MLKKPFSPETMRPLACSALAMFLAMPVAVSATSFDLTDTTTTYTTQQTLGNGESGIVESGVVLWPTASSSVLVNGDAAGLTNQGYIFNTVSAVVRVDALMSGAIVNNGLILGPVGHRCHRQRQRRRGDL